MVKRFLVCCVLFSAVFSCGACTATLAARRAEPVACVESGPPKTLVRLIEERDRESSSFYCEASPPGLVCTDFERFMLWKLSKETPAPSVVPQSL